MAALIPAVLMTVVFAVMKFAPFGDSSILITDMSQQYIDYFAGYRDVLTEGKSMFYTWNTGMGMNFLGLFGYYLSSPFSLIVLLFPKSMIVESRHGNEYCKDSRLRRYFLLYARIHAEKTLC